LKKLDCIEVSRYTNGWYSCFAIPEIYEHFPKKELRAQLLDIIHTSMYAKYSDLGRPGNWYDYLGNLPFFLKQIKSDVDWGKLLKIFCSLLTYRQYLVMRYK